MDSRLVIENPERMNLLGLLIKGFLEQQLQRPKLARKANRLRGDFGLQAGSMAITLSFGPEVIRIKHGLLPKLRARASGPMEEMVSLVVGGGGLLGAVIAVLEGRITIRGNPFALLGLLPLMMGAPPPKPKELPPKS